MMYWTQDEAPEAIAVPDDVADVLFALDCRRLPVDHAYDLSEALSRAFPWMRETPELAVHTVHVAGSQNGWERPTHGSESYLLLSRRTKLAIRAPRERLADLLRELPGTRIEVAGCPLAIGEGKAKPLSKETTLFARHVACAPGQDEQAFLAWVAAALRDLDVRVRKALCGKSLALSTPDGPIDTKSLLLADLSVPESFRLQRHGLGPQRLMGCGIFIPHKGIDAVGQKA